MSTKTYALDITREGRWWMVYCAELDATTQATKLGEVEEMARDLIAGLLDIDEASFSLSMQVIMPSEVTAMLEAADRDEREAREAQRKAADERRAALASLHADFGIPVPEVAAMFEITKSRAYSLIRDHNGAGEQGKKTPAEPRKQSEFGLSLAG